MSQQSSGMIAGPSVYSNFIPEPKKKEPVDTMPHDSQPPGVDEEETQTPE